jgi:CDP-6-deoxy-D-xylo-4-hexulose-3-dehydrase
MSLENSISNFLQQLQTQDFDLYKFQSNKLGNDFDSEKDSVFYSGPYWDNREIAAILESVLEGKWLSSGEKVNKFERQFSKVINADFSLMVNSGSSANLVMVAALKKFYGWNDGDEIIVSVVGFPTTASSIVQNSLVPVFVDITWDNLNWDLEQISSKITSKTRAIFSSPVLGNSYDMDFVLDLCDKYKILLIADNCDSLGSKWRGKFLNEYSVAASCSFYPAHHITTMEGGMVSANSEELIKIARSISWWGRACYCVGQQNLLPNGVCKKRFDRWVDDCDYVLDHKYLFENVGYNLKPLDLQGAVGIIQLTKLSEMEALRKRNKNFLDSAFRRIDGTKTLTEIEHAETSWFGKPIICDSGKLKASLVSYLESNRVQTRNYFAGNLLIHPAYRKYGSWKDFPNANGVLEKVFFVGVSPTINLGMLEYIDDLCKKFPQ